VGHRKFNDCENRLICVKFWDYAGRGWSQACEKPCFSRLFDVSNMLQNVSKAQQLANPIFFQLRVVLRIRATLQASG
jgi:hypothetical protein